LAATIRVSDRLPTGWNSLVEATGSADFFHTPTWFEAVGRGYPDLQPLWITAQAGDDLLAGLAAVRRVRSGRLPGSITRLESHLDGTSGGPLVRDDLPEPTRQILFQQLLEAYLAQRTGLLSGCSFSLNTGQEASFGPLLESDPRWACRQVPGAVIDLTSGLEQVEMTCLTNNKRNERNRGLKRGAGFFSTGDPEYLRRYYPIYEQAARQWGTPAVPLVALEELLAAGPDHAFFTCVTLGDEILGGHLCLVRGDRVMAWNGVTDPAHARTHFPATLAIWGDIVECCRRGARSLDLGASGGVNSLRGFKKSFGARLESRGFYTNQSAGLKLVQGARNSWGRWSSFLTPPDRQRRWHDGRTGNPADPAGKEPS
jgi:hypothetical protein